MNITEIERLKYQKIWAVPIYHVNSPGERLVPLFMQHCGWEPGDTLIDLGCGTGRAGKKFAKAGMDVTLLDFVNAVDDNNHLPFIEMCLWELPKGETFDWIFSADVLEHIPTERVADVLDGMARLTGKGGMLQIAQFPDGCGNMIGETLHLTIKPTNWWMDKINARWNARIVDGESGRLLVALGKPL